MKQSSRNARGLSFTEVLTVLAILGLMATMVALDAAAIIGRARASTTLAGINQVFAAARLQAVKRGVQVVVEVTLESPRSRINLRTFEDREPDFRLGTYLPDPPATVPVPESILSDVALDTTFHLWKKGAAMDDLSAAVLFRSYSGNATVTNRIVFLPDGGILPPEDGSCGLPTPSGGRGVYFADFQGKNFFRLTIAGNLVAVPVVQKWVSASAGYASTGWSWQ